MSYCTFSNVFGDSDVYVLVGMWYTIHTKNNPTLHPRLDGSSFFFDELADMREKLVELSDAGVAVPQEVFDRIDKDLSND